MAPKTAQSGKQPKKRIDLNNPKVDPHSRQYPWAACLIVLVAQVLLRIWDMGCFLIFSFGACVVSLLAMLLLGEKWGTPLLGIFATAFFGIMLGALDSEALFWFLVVVPTILFLFLLPGLLTVFAAHPFSGGILSWRETRTGAASPPKFLDREREDRIHFVELLARLAVDFSCTDAPFTEAKREVIHAFFAQVLSYEGARLAAIRIIVQEEWDRLMVAIDTLVQTQATRRTPLCQLDLWFQDIVEEQLCNQLRDFRRTCSYGSHLMLLALLFRVAQASGPDREKALDLAQEIGLALDLEPQVVQDIEAQSRVSEAERAQEEARRQREESERQERTERARREQERAERRRREEETRRRRRQEEEEARRRAYEQTYRAEASREEQALAVLGLDSGAKFSAVKKRYRRLIVQHHPDKVAHLGEAARRAAEEKTKKLNAAYSYLEERYGR